MSSGMFSAARAKHWLTEANWFNLPVMEVKSYKLHTCKQDCRNWWKKYFKKSYRGGRRIAQSVVRATHVPRLCSGPGFDSRPGSLCCVSLPVSYPVSCLTLQLHYQIKPEKAKKILKKKKNHTVFILTDIATVTWFTISSFSLIKLLN